MGQPYRHPGPNLTADLVLLRNGAQGREILLVQRSENSPAEPGKWALPGGFVETDAARGEPWKPGLETPRQAAVRETKEETRLDVSRIEGGLKRIGVFEGGGRDPRDNAEAWSKSTAYVLDIGDTPLPEPEGADDAAQAKWVPLARAVSLPLAFDHRRIIAQGVEIADGKRRPEEELEAWRGLDFRRGAPLIQAASTDREIGK